jgi:Spy/CpxP family protein refolding chaperone
MDFMYRTARRASVCALVLLCATSVGAQGFKWWQSDRYKADLGLTADQSRKLEDIFQNALPTLRTQKKALDTAEAELERLVARGDDGAVMAQVARVETTRAELNTSRTLMLLKMRRALTADQWVKFGALHQTLEHEREQALQKSNAAPK